MMMILFSSLLNRLGGFRAAGLGLLLGCSALHQVVLAEAPPRVSLATTQWCPYTCSVEGHTYGFVGQYLEHIFTELDVELSISSYPWSRAIHLAQSKQVDGLMTAIPAEAPDLLFSEAPISSYKMCFYTSRLNDWHYTDTLDFGNNALMVVQDYGYGEPLDSYIAKHPHITKVSGGDVIQRLVASLNSGRADIIVVDELVLQHENTYKTMNLELIKQAGCLPENDFFLALSPTPENKMLLKKISDAFKQPHNQAYLSTLISEIGKE